MAVWNRPKHCLKKLTFSCNEATNSILVLWSTVQPGENDTVEQPMKPAGSQDVRQFFQRLNKDYKWRQK